MTSDVYGSTSQVDTLVDTRADTPIDSPVSPWLGPDSEVWSAPTTPARLPPHPGPAPLVPPGELPALDLARYAAAAEEGLPVEPRVDPLGAPVVDPLPDRLGDAPVLLRSLRVDTHGDPHPVRVDTWSDTLVDTPRPLADAPVVPHAEDVLSPPDPVTEPPARLQEPRGPLPSASAPPADLGAPQAAEEAPRPRPLRRDEAEGTLGGPRVDGPSPRVALDRVTATPAAEAPRAELPEAAPRLPERLVVQVDDPHGAWQVEAHRHADRVDLHLHANAEVQQIVRAAEPELRATLGQQGEPLGQLSFSQGSERHERPAPAEPPAPRAPRVVRAPPPSLRVGRLLDRDA